MEEFIDVDIDNPVQIFAKGMDPEKLKKEYGEQITFWGGGADVQHVLPFASREEVIEQVKKLIKIFAPGGFCICQFIICSQIHHHRILLQLLKQHIDVVYIQLGGE